MITNRVYLDNAATSFPKPPGVAKAMSDYILNIGINVHRTVGDVAIGADMALFKLREQLCGMFGWTDCANVIITPGATFALNTAIKGTLKPGDHCIVSSMEHNAVMRPLAQLEGVEVERIQSDSDGTLSLSSFVKLFRSNTKLVVCTAVSNVSGTIMPIPEMASICRERGVFFAVDAAQAVGHIDMSFEGVSAICLPAHKGLMGPPGIGAMLLTQDMAEYITPIVAGGTGSVSDLETLPDFLPDKFESGTLNIAGVYGWNAALDFIREAGLEELSTRMRAVTRQFIEGVEVIEGVRIIGRKQDAEKSGVVSLDFLSTDNALVAYNLSSEHGIETRCGLHCSPSAHLTLGTYPKGTVRFSFSPFITPQCVKHVLSAIQDCVCLE